jgi:hypothetical protein
MRESSGETGKPASGRLAPLLSAFTEKERTAHFTPATINAPSGTPVTKKKDTKNLRRIKFGNSTTSNQRREV